MLTCGEASVLFVLVMVSNSFYKLYIESTATTVIPFTFSQKVRTLLATLESI